MLGASLFQEFILQALIDAPQDLFVELERAWQRSVYTHEDNAEIGRLVRCALVQREEKLRAMLTAKLVNDELRKRGHKERIACENGRVYFFGGSVKYWCGRHVTSLQLNELSLEGWIEKRDALAKGN